MGENKLHVSEALHIDTHSEPIPWVSLQYISKKILILILFYIGLKEVEKKKSSIFFSRLTIEL